MPTPSERVHGFGHVPFVGRQSQLDALLRSRAAAYNGTRTLTLISGEMGSGRSRLLEEFCRRPELTSHLVVRLRLYPGDDGSIAPFLRGPLLDALRSRPHLRRSVEEELAVGRGMGDVARQLGRTLDRLSRSMFLVVVVDGLTSPRLTSSLIDLLHQVEHPYLLVVSGEPQSLETARQLAASLSARLEQVDLGRLRGESVATLVDELFGLAIAEEDLNWLLEVSHGLPLLVREALRALVDQGILDRTDGSWRTSAPFRTATFAAGDALPLLRSQLARLTEDERRSLASLALLGRSVPFRTVRRIGLNAEAERALRLREALRRDGDLLIFTHETVHDAALAEGLELGLLVEQAAALREVLSEPVALHELTPPQVVLRLLVEMSDDEERAELVAGLRRRGCELHASESYAAAIDALVVSGLQDAIEAGEVAADRVGTEVRALADSYYKLGRVVEQRRLLESFLELEAARFPSRELAPIVIGFVLDLVEVSYREKRLDHGFALIQRAVGLLDDAPVESRHAIELEIEFQRAGLLRMAERQHEAAVIYRRIVDAAPDEEISPRAFDALIALTGMVDEIGHSPAIIARIRTMEELCRRDGRSRAALQLRAVLVQELYRQGEIARFEAEAHALADKLQQASLPRTEANIWCWLALIEAERGNYSEGIRLLDRAIEIRWQVKSIAMWQLAMIIRGTMLLYARRDAEAEGAFQRVVDDAREHGRTYRRFLLEVGMTMIALRRGEELDDATLDRLRLLGNEERFESVEEKLLELEMERLAMAEEVCPKGARLLAERVMKLPKVDEDFPWLLMQGVILMGRAGLAPRPTRKRGKEREESSSIVARSLRALEIWCDGKAHHHIAWYAPRLDLHARGLFPQRSLEPYLRIAAEIGSDAGATAQLEVRTFGRLRVLDRSGAERGGRHFGTMKSDSKPRKVLAALVAAAVQGRRLTRERLIDMVWGESTSEESAANTFHVTMSGLRQVIGDAIEFDGSTYALSRSALRIDALEFHRLVDEARDAEGAGMDYRAFDLLLDACELCSGPFLEGIYDEWCEGGRELLRARVREARLRLAEMAMTRGEHDLAREAVQDLFDADAADEEAMRLSLRILVEEGERLRALRQYEQFERRLQREYSVEPSRRLKELRRELSAS